MSGLHIYIPGRPVPQGSKRHIGRGVMIEQSPHVRAWRQDVTAAAKEAAGADWTPLHGPVRVDIDFRFARPRSHYGTGRNAAVVRDSAPRWPAGRPDVDKLTRAVLDALTAAGIWRDDAQVVDLSAYKDWTTVGACCEIYVEPA